MKMSDLINQAVKAQGGNKALISVVHNHLVSEKLLSDKITLENFKTWCFDSWRDSELELCRADMPIIWGLEEVQASEIEHMGSTLHLIKI